MAVGSSKRRSMHTFSTLLGVAAGIGMVFVVRPGNLSAAGLPSGARAAPSRVAPAPPHMHRVANPARRPGKPAVATSTDDTQLNKNIPFEISFIDGLSGSYSAGEPIEFLVEGRSPVHVEALPENGFKLAATLTDSARSNDIQAAAVKYDEDKRLWNVKLTAPKDPSKSYEIMIQLYCDKGESPCAEVYGAAAQTSTVVPLDIY